MITPDGHLSVINTAKRLGISKTRVHAIIQQGRFVPYRETVDGIPRVWISIEDIEREEKRRAGEDTEPTHREKLHAIERDAAQQRARDEREERERAKLDAERAEEQRVAFKDADEARFRAAMTAELRLTRIALEKVGSQLFWLNASLGIVALRFGVDLAAELKPAE